MGRFGELLLFFLASALLPGVRAATKSYTWDITSGPISKGSSKEVYLINRKWPPQAIEVDLGDKIVLKVNNIDIDEGVTFHAHGFHQKNRNGQDGAASVTQWYHSQASRDGSTLANTQEVQYPREAPIREEMRLVGLLRVRD